MDLPDFYPDLMVDLETTGTDPSFSAIIQIAAVRFNYETGKIGPIFSCSLAIPYGRFWDEGTREFWMKMPGIYQSIVDVAEPADVAFKRFAAWCRETAPAIAVDQALWAKPTHFEWPLLQSYCRQFDEDLGFHFRHAIDLNSFCRGLANNPRLRSLDKDVEFVGEVHNAIDDTAHQVKVALMAKSLIEARNAQV